ncbi:hypothetical protein OQA88_1484 [Cercophora sp. LCS_1]
MPAKARIQILSDLHLEQPKPHYDLFTVTPAAPYLALLGDIGDLKPPQGSQAGLLDFLTTQLRQFRAVFYVPGNHEAYHSSWPATLSALRDFEAQTRADPSIGDFILLDQGFYRIPDTEVVILGCRLFSHIPADKEQRVWRGLTDFWVTDKWTPVEHNAAHKRDVAWLNAQVAELEQEDDVRIVIFSHWGPTTDDRAVEPVHRGSDVSCAFITDLSGEKCFRSEKVKIWGCGHTHYNFDFVKEREGEGLRIVTNQRGYYSKQALGWDEEKVIEV